MYARFLRWASDRVDANGIVAFVSNSSFIDSRTFDGFRKVVAQEFNEIWIVDLTREFDRVYGQRLAPPLWCLESYIECLTY